MGLRQLQHSRSQLDPSGQGVSPSTARTRPRKESAALLQGAQC